MNIQIADSIAFYRCIYLRDKHTHIYREHTQIHKHARKKKEKRKNKKHELIFDIIVVQTLNSNALLYKLQLVHSLVVTNAAE